MKWTDEQVREIQAMYRSGLSADAISIRLNRTRSRNSIQGKLQKTGVFRKGYKPVPEQMHRKRSKPRKHVTDPSVKGRLTLLELCREHCRWPFGDKETGFTFCAEPVQGDAVYCTEHTERARGRSCK